MTDGRPWGKGLLVTAAIVFVAVPLVVMASWFVTETMIESTSGERFCTSCHSMRPMGAAYRKDVHGGNSTHGVQVECVGCHLPHDNAATYLVSKAITGMRDVWAELTYDLDSIDWEAKRAAREHYVYDSGCLKCHSNVQQATMADSKAFVAHKPYFLGTTDKKCVTCHAHVGHRDLGVHLTKAD